MKKKKLRVVKSCRNKKGCMKTSWELMQLIKKAA